MCLIALAWGAHPRLPLVIAANRDEYYARPTAALTQWTTSTGHTLVSGRDLRDGGTWMGFTANGRFAMLTNLREIPDHSDHTNSAQMPQVRSRGELVVNWLTSTQDAAEWSLVHPASNYAGFNLIVGDWYSQQCHYLSSHTAPIALQRGFIYGLSNAALDTPWPKTLQLKAQMQSVLHNAPSIAPSVTRLQWQLQQALLDETRAQGAQLPQTGVPLAVEHALSSVFVRHPQPVADYGTRTSLVAVLDHTHRLHMTETTHALGTQASLTLDWSPDL